MEILLLDTYRERLPYDGPPSYRGSGIKYAYKLVIGIQKLNCPTQLMRLPLRVLVLPGKHTFLLFMYF